MGALTVRFPESLHERVRGLAEQEGISMNQFAVLAVSEKVARLDAEAQPMYLDALERIGEELASEQGASLAEAARAVLDKAAESQATESRSAENKAKGGRRAEARHTSNRKTTASARNSHRSMSKKNDRIVYRRDDGKWANKKNSASKASSVHDTQAEAQKAARQMLKNQSGGELTTKGRDGKIRSKDTIAPGRDPNPPKDTEH